MDEWFEVSALLRDHYVEFVNEAVAAVYPTG
jgi:hypothetical protein